jgi:ferredoxin/predicted transcriptional regulator
MSDVYADLREFLHTFPGGYPSTPTGVEIKLLKKLFSPEDAEMYLSLTKEPEVLADIAKRLGRDKGELGEKLEDMAKRGLIFRNRDGDKVLYKAYQFFVGIIEAQINKVDAELAQLMDEFFPFLGAQGLTLPTKQMRVIPADTAVEAKTTVAPYNRMRELIKDDELIAVAPCICTQMADTRGSKCEHTIERCLAFGDMAQYYIDNGIARKISKDELMKLLDTVEKEGLVLNTSNTKELSFTCCCCICCCGPLQALKLIPQASIMANVCYNAKIDPESCIQCGDCVDRCPVDAITEADETMEVSVDKCIGCGLCVSVCQEEAIDLTEVATATHPFPSETEMFTSISKDRGLI